MLVIGEKINIITKTIAKAMEERDPQPIQDLAKAQVAAGANILDINIGPARKNGPELMEWLVKVTQEVVDVPLSLDTTNAAATEAGLKVHRGNALINSTSTAPERMQSMFPLAAKYGSDIIGLTLASRGMPKDANERCSLAVDLLGAAAEYGVEPERIYLDPIFLSVNGMQAQAMGVLEAIEMFQALNEPPMKTVCGLSNVSNGSPEHMRSILNRTYLVMAMKVGLTSAIMDPLDDLLMDRLRKAEAMGNNIVFEDIFDADELKTVEVLRNNILYCHSYLDMQ